MVDSLRIIIIFHHYCNIFVIILSIYVANPPYMKPQVIQITIMICTLAVTFGMEIWSLLYIPWALIQGIKNSRYPILWQPTLNLRTMMTRHSTGILTLYQQLVQRRVKTGVPKLLQLNQLKSLSFSIIFGRGFRLGVKRIDSVIGGMPKEIKIIFELKTHYLDSGGTV